MAKWDFKINEIAIPEREGEQVKVRFRTLKDGELQKEMNFEVAIDPAALDGKTDEEKFAIIKTQVRQRGEAITGKLHELQPLKRMESYEFSAVDEGTDKPVPDPTAVVTEPAPILKN